VANAVTGDSIDAGAVAARKAGKISANQRTVFMVGHVVTPATDRLENAAYRPLTARGEHR
jgi:hypothetical protein